MASRCLPRKICEKSAANPLDKSYIASFTLLILKMMLRTSQARSFFWVEDGNTRSIRMKYLLEFQGPKY